MTHLSNPLATADQLYRRLLPDDLLDSILFSAQCLTQAAGLLLQLPQSQTAQANIVLARYWLVDAPMAHEFSDVSAASIYLIAKLGPSPRPPRDVALVYTYLLSTNSSFFRRKTAPPPANDPSSYYLSEAEYISFHARILALEARILHALSFDTHVALPHPLAVTYLQALEFLSHPKAALSRRTLEYLNTALLSPQLLYLTHQPNALAVAAIYNAAKDVGAKMPECEWWEVFDVDREALGFLVVGMRSLEGWVRQQREALPAFWEGMLTRRMVEAEMAQRGLSTRNGGASKASEDDEEERMMRQMDRRVAQMADES